MNYCKTNHSRQRRGQILDAASELFEEAGHWGLNIDRIAAHLKLSKGVIYYHFHNKEEIALQLIVRMLRNRNERLGSLCGNNCSARERLVSACLADLVFHHEHLCYSTLSNYVRLKHVQFRTQRKTQELADFLFNKPNAFYSGLVRYGVAQGDLILPDQSSCEDIAFIMESMIIGAVNLIPQTKSLESNAEIFEGNVNCLLDGLGWKH